MEAAFDVKNLHIEKMGPVYLKTKGRMSKRVAGIKVQIVRREYTC